MTRAGKRTGDRRARLAGLAAPLLLVVACFASTLVEASVPRGAAGAPDGASRIASLVMPAALDVARLAPDIYEPGFALFAGDELGPALGQGDGAPRFALGIAAGELDVDGQVLASRVRELSFHPLQGLDLIDTEPLRGPPEREPKTRIGGLELSGPFLQRERPRLSLGLRWGCGPDSCRIASEQRFDPLGLVTQTRAEFGQDDVFATVDLETGNKLFDSTVLNTTNTALNHIGFLGNAGLGALGAVDRARRWGMKKLGANDVDIEAFDMFFAMNPENAAAAASGLKYGVQRATQAAGKVLAKVGQALSEVRAGTGMSHPERGAWVPGGVRRVRKSAAPIAAGTLERGNINANIVGGVPEGYRGHHLITVREAQNYPVMHRAAELGYDINRGRNGIALPHELEEARKVGLPVHRGRHIPDYVEFVSDELGRLQRRYDAGGVQDKNLLTEIGQVEDRIRGALVERKVKLQHMDTE